MVCTEIKNKFLSVSLRDLMLEDKAVKTVKRSPLKIYFISLCTPYL